jgi:hypothetical protein
MNTMGVIEECTCRKTTPYEIISVNLYNCDETINLEETVKPLFEKYEVNSLKERNFLTFTLSRPGRQVNIKLNYFKAQDNIVTELEKESKGIILSSCRAHLLSSCPLVPPSHLHPLSHPLTLSPSLTHPLTSHLSPSLILSSCLFLLNVLQDSIAVLAINVNEPRLSINNPGEGYNCLYQALVKNTSMSP